MKPIEFGPCIGRDCTEQKASWSIGVLLEAPVNHRGGNRNVYKDTGWFLCDNCCKKYRSGTMRVETGQIVGVGVIKSIDHEKGTIEIGPKEEK